MAPRYGGLVRWYPIIRVNIITFLSRRHQEAERELEAMAYQRVGQRLAAKLIDSTKPTDFCL